MLEARTKAKYLQFENRVEQNDARREHMRNMMLGMFSLGGGGQRGNIFDLLTGNAASLEQQLELVLEIDRSNIVSSALNQLSYRESNELRKRLNVKFKGEPGVDQGGLTKEFFQLLIADLFDVKYGMLLNVVYFFYMCF